jgi:hypothetical protein
VPSGRARDSAFRKGGETGAEKPMTDEAESKGWELEVASVSQDLDDSFRTRDVYSGTGSGVKVRAVDRFSLVSGPAHGATIS